MRTVWGLISRQMTYCEIDAGAEWMLVDRFRSLCTRNTVSLGCDCVIFKNRCMYTFKTSLRIYVTFL